jgi:hypothetical protein
MLSPPRKSTSHISGNLTLIAILGQPYGLVDLNFESIGKFHITLESPPNDVFLAI